MDYRALLAVASVAAAVALAAMSLRRVRTSGRSSLTLWVYAGMFAGVAMLLWQHRVVPVVNVPAVPDTEVQRMPEPADTVAVQEVPIPPVQRRIPIPLLAVDTVSAAEVSDEQMDRVISRMLDAIESSARRQGLSVTESDSSARSANAPLEIEIPLLDTRARPRKTPV
jgi:hypothetical protein